MELNPWQMKAKIVGAIQQKIAAIFDVDRNEANRTDWRKWKGEWDAGEHRGPPARPLEEIEDFNWTPITYDKLHACFEAARKWDFYNDSRNGPDFEAWGAYFTTWFADEFSTADINGVLNCRKTLESILERTYRAGQLGSNDIIDPEKGAPHAK